MFIALSQISRLSALCMQKLYLFPPCIAQIPIANHKNTIAIQRNTMTQLQIAINGTQVQSKEHNNSKSNRKSMEHPIASVGQKPNRKRWHQASPEQGMLPPFPVWLPPNLLSAGASALGTLRSSVFFFPVRCVH